MKVVTIGKPDPAFAGSVLGLLGLKPGEHGASDDGDAQGHDNQEATTDDD